MKVCISCKKPKSISEFYTRKSTKDKLSSWCKDCCKEYKKAYYVEHKTIIIERTTSYQFKSKNKENFKKIKQIAARKYQAKNPHIIKCHTIVRAAISNGTLTRAKYCSKCGSNRQRIEAHHDSYLEPLLIRWLCQTCHANWHRHNIAEGA